MPVPSQAGAPTSTPAPMAGPSAADPSAGGPAGPSAGPSASGNAPRRNAGTSFTMAGGWGSQPQVAQQANQAGAPSSIPGLMAGPSAAGPSAGPPAGPSASGNAPRRNTGMSFTMAGSCGSQPQVNQPASRAAAAASTPAPMTGPSTAGPSAGPSASGNAPRNAGTSFTMAGSWGSQPQSAQQALRPFQAPSANGKGKGKVHDSPLVSAATPPQADTPSTPAAPRPGHKALPAFSQPAPPSLVFPPPAAPPAVGFPPPAAPPSMGFPPPVVPSSLGFLPPAAPPSLGLPPPAPPPMNHPWQTLQIQPPLQWVPHIGQTPSHVACQAPQYFHVWNEYLATFARLSYSKPGGFQLLVGLWFKETGCFPNIVGNQQGRFGLLSQTWRYDYRNMDLLDHAPHLAHEVWQGEMADQDIKDLACLIGKDVRALAIFQEAIRTWAQDRANDMLVTETFHKANLTQGLLQINNDEHETIGEIFKMEDCEEKRRKLEEAKSTRPRFYQACLDDFIFCGTRKVVMRYDNCDDTYEHFQHRKPSSLEYEDLPPPQTRPPEIFNMDEEGIGRPVQVHAVPLEERAFDSQGNRLPWGLEFHKDHPKARGQKHHVEETGPFGKSNRRRGSSRTRTTTPAKKENPTLDGFQKAWEQELKSQQESSNLHLQNEAPQHPVSANKTPTQVIIFGYGFDMQWAALSSYERFSGGMICEDYARDPPSGAKRYPSTFGAPQIRRARTKAERALAARYDGGNYWVKVTFDSADAAAHAVTTSPYRIYGHWVYAQPYHGHGPEKDEPIPVKAGEHDQGRPTNLLSSRSQRNNAQQQQGSSTFSQSFAPSSEATQNQSHNTSPSSTTATSATATGTDYPDLHQRRNSQAQTPNTGDQLTHDPEMMRHFPDIPRTKLHPASEAFLPQLSWWERQIKTLSDYGLIPGDIIGHVMPVKEDGTLDSDKASFYWKFFYWIDSHFGTEICGGKDD